MNQITVTRGDDRELTFTIAADYTDTTASFTVDGLFTNTGTVEVSSGGETTVTVTVAGADTEDAPDVRRAYRYELQMTDTGGEVQTVRRGLLVVIPDLTPVT